jgi:hypothetical protein
MDVIMGRKIYPGTKLMCLEYWIELPNENVWIRKPSIWVCCILLLRKEKFVIEKKQESFNNISVLRLGIILILCGKLTS